MNDEAALVERAKKDPEAYGILYDQHVDRIYRYLLGRTGNVHIAEDLTAETFLAALKSLWRYRWTGKPFAAWLYRIALAQVGEHYRRQNRTPTIAMELAEELPDVRPPEANDMLTAEYLALHQALRWLSPQQHEAIVLRYFEDLPIAEIAWITEQPKNTVKSHLRRGLQHLHNLLASYSYDAGQPRTIPAPRPAVR